MASYIVNREEPQHVLLAASLRAVALQLGPGRVRTERVVQKLGDHHVVLRRLDNVFVGANQGERCAEVVFLFRTGSVHHDGVEPEPQRSQRMLPRGDTVRHVGEGIWEALLGVRDELPHVEQLAEERVAGHVEGKQNSKDGLAADVPALDDKGVPCLQVASETSDVLGLRGGDLR